jgi:hypothetical protein
MSNHREVVTVGPYTFNFVFPYYEFGDSIAVREREGQGGECEETPEGHQWVYEIGEDHINGIDFEGVKYWVKKQGELRITLPSGEVVRVEGLDDVLQTI